jgi:hypothetical protein
MKGIVFNVFEEVVSNALGPWAWDDLLTNADVGGAYTSLGSYPDEEFQALVASAATTLERSPREALRWFGRQAMPILARQYPGFFTEHSSAHSFILNVNGIIHPEVRKLYPGAKCPHFDFRKSEVGSLLLGYRSQRRMCDLAHGFINGAADFYRESVAVDHLTCMHSGDEKCLIEVTWRS